ncbi:MAG: YARHG domain-containing protein [Hyphomicrobiales bacterium]|nr:YARHG domain-containing protein [Hyphomicrobiales bacterium]
MTRRLLTAAATLVLLVGASATAFADVFPNSSYRVIARWEFDQLSCQDLWVARNEIYARNGYCFKTRRARGYFGNAGCFTSRPDFNRVENTNIERIKDAEYDFGCR